jgi:DNA invertase Pin-like site-specific DNA recombinase
VVVWSLDRIGRTMFQVLGDVLELERGGCHVVSVRESWVEQASGTARNPMLAFMAWVAEHEHERLSERTKAGMARARASGKPIGRPPVLTPSAIERAALLRQRGESWGHIVRILEAEKFGHDLTRGAVERAVSTRAVGP